MAGKRGKPKAELELFGVTHVGWRDSLDFAHRLSRGKFDTVFVEAVPSSQREAKEVAKLLRSGRAVPYSPYVLLEEEFFSYLTAAMWMLPKKMRKVKQVVNLDAIPTGRDLPTLPVGRWLENKAVGWREVWNNVREDIYYLLERDAIALATLSTTPFRRAIGWRGAHHIPSMAYLISSAFSYLSSHLTIRFIYSKYYVSTVATLERFSPDFFPYLFEHISSLSGEKKRGEVLLLLAHHLLSLLLAGEPLPQAVRDYRRGFMVVFGEEVGEVEVSMPPLWRKLGFSYPFVERIKAIPYHMMEKLWLEVMGGVAEEIADQWMGRRGKATFTEAFMWRVYRAYNAYLDALFQYFGGLDALKVEIKPKP